MAAGAAAGTLDHVAVRVVDREATTERLLRLLDWTVLQQDERLTLLGADPGRGKLTLLDAPGGSRPAPGRLVSLLLAHAPGQHAQPPVQLADGVLGSFVETAQLDPGWTHEPRHAIVGVSLRASDPPLAAALLDADFGMGIRAVGSDLALLDVGGHAQGGRLTFSRERWDVDEPDVLDHVGIQVPDASRWRERAERSGVQILRWVEGDHSRAAFARGPDDLLLEFVELTAPLGT